MEQQEDSPVGGRGLKGMLAKSRRVRDDATGEASPIREASDAVLSKIKSRIGSIDDDEPHDGKLSKLLTKRKERKRQKEMDSDGYRGRPGERNTPTSATMGTSGSLGNLSGQEEESSLLTSESEEETSNAAPPPLLSHDSHTGYLTSSSPNIRATTLADDSALGAAESSSPKTNRSLSKSVTLPSPFSSRDSKPVKHNTLAIDTAKAGSSLSVDSQGSTNSTKSRSISPGSKLKDAFRPPRKNGALPSDNIERPSSSPGLSGFFNKDKTGNIASRRATKAAEGASSAQNAKAMSSSTLQSQKSIPSIVTPQEESGTSDAQDAPATTITPPTPVDSTSIKPEQAEENASTSAKDSNGLGNTVTHRRARSESASHKPSKLSQAMSAPLTPMAEEPKAMGSRNVSGNTTASSGGFFSSVFSAAQNAANTLSNTITNNQQRPRSTTTQSAPFSEDKISAPSTTESQEIRPEVIKPLAVDTIGSGDLSLSHLGISNDSQSATVGSASPASSKGPIERSRSGTVIHREEAAAREEDLSAARAISAAYGENAGQKVPTPIAEDPSFGTKTSSAYEQSINGDKTTPNGSIFEGDTSGLWRSGSLRNKVDRAKRRHRNSSGTTVGAGSIINNQGVNASPGNGSVPKLTGFAVASKKRNRDFHQLFRSVPEDDYLIEDYSCALQRDIILAGRIYISEGHICFSSNILGWVTTLVISFDEVVSVEKESTAMVFPNAIAIQTLHARHTFRSLLSRDSTYDLLIGIWKISHPSLQSSENGVRLVNGGTGSKTEKVDIEDSDDGSNSSGDNDDVYDEDEDDEDGTDGQRSLPGTADGSVADSEVAESPPKASVARKASALGIAAGQAAGGVLTVGESKAAEKANGVALASGDFPGPTTHSPTECADSASHYEKILKDEVIPAPLGKVYSMIFGATSGGFMSRWLLDEVKVMDLQMDDDKKGLNDENKTRSFSYIKPLTGSIGPRQTKCVITEQLDAFDLEKAVSVTVTTQTPDVPSGSVFSTKTRYCLMWGPNNGTRLIMCCMIEWTGKSWIKGAIEKGANDGQTTYANDLVKAVKAGVLGRARAGTSGSKAKKGRKRKGDLNGTKSPTSHSSNRNEISSWGIFEPLYAVFGRLFDVIRPLFNTYGIIGLLFILLVGSLFRNWRLRSTGDLQGAYDQPRLSSSRRAAIYEEVWRTEEDALWDWLESRVGIPEGFITPESGRSNHENRNKATKKPRAHVANGNLRSGKGVGNFLQDAKTMGERELEWAISVTEGKLKTLRNAMGKGNGKSSAGHQDEDEFSEEDLEELERFVKDEL